MGEVLGGRFVRFEGGLAIDLPVGRPTIKVGRPLSGQVGVVEGELPPGGGFQVPHWHEDLDEVFSVLEGEIEFLLDGSWQSATAGHHGVRPRRHGARVPQHERAPSAAASHRST
jgi:hypothetical protein